MHKVIFLHACDRRGSHRLLGAAYVRWNSCLFFRCLFCYSLSNSITKNHRVRWLTYLKRRACGWYCSESNNIRKIDGDTPKCFRDHGVPSRQLICNTPANNMKWMFTYLPICIYYHMNWLVSHNIFINAFIAHKINIYVCDIKLVC